ncbi:hypothetical protein LEP1GSC036_1772 [Leptospira weilii str. 2006001853]|uniref:Uncharacterized protein n=1 Tax=Leptospira weilii str. 2006001853 TaxID=1001589 RepID=A0A828Z2T6_9LEPT|nr:hypothetical protein LEP1GSC036_1772 [Leptospira weilii str. 2006001853]EMN42861.1 hypothetical protein LEP1GSC086_1949 [Leptospira weilii str. LNT 1234]
MLFLSIAVAVASFQRNQTKTLMRKSEFYFFHKDEYYKAVFCFFELTKKVASFESFSKKVCRQSEIGKE